MKKIQKIFRKILRIGLNVYERQKYSKKNEKKKKNTKLYDEFWVNLKM